MITAVVIALVGCDCCDSTLKVLQLWYRTLQVSSHSGPDAYVKAASEEAEACASYKKRVDDSHSQMK